MRENSGCFGELMMLAAATVLFGLLIVAIGIGAASSDGQGARSLPIFSSAGLTWDHAGREIAERERTARERIRQEQETQRAADWQDFGRVVVVAAVIAGAVWIVARETGATVRHRDGQRAKVAMYQLYMRQQYPAAHIEVHDGQQLVVDPDSRTVFPLAVLRAEARAAGYDEM